jgi:peptide/nickel transport system substrate-binding protein
MTRPRIVTAAAGAAIVTLALAACGGSSSGGAGSSSSSAGSSSSGGAVGYNAALTQVVNPSTATGGTLKFVHPDDWDSPDPGNTYYAFSWNFSRLYARTLMTFKDVPGTDGLTLVPDLAQAPGQASADGLTWTYHLRSGLKFDDGTPITSKDIKYAVERTYATDVLSNGPTYFHDHLIGSDYTGPYKDTTPGKLGLKGIETPDDSTVVFKLNKPFSEFDYLATLSQTAPVPQAKDTGAKYLTSIVSSGPYKIDSYEPGKEMKLSKNPNWSAATDPNRKQLVDAIDVTLKVEANDLDNRLLAGDADIALDGTGVQAAAKAKILTNPTVKANADNPLTGFLRYVAINTTMAPLDNVECRKAVIYAADHQALQTAYGGPTSGDIATTVLPPNVLGYAKADTYGLLTSPSGDLTKAKAALTACGQPNGFSTVITARANRPKEVAGATALQQSLAKVGIKADIQTYPSGQYFSNFAGSTAFDKQKGVGLMFMGWGADWPSGYGFLQQIVDSRAIKASGNSNLSQLKDPAVDALFDQSATVTDATARNAIWTQIDQKVMADAAILPIVYDKALLYRNPEVTNVFVEPAYGMYSYDAMGIKK